MVAGSNEWWGVELNRVVVFAFAQSINRKRRTRRANDQVSERGETVEPVTGWCSAGCLLFLHTVPKPATSENCEGDQRLQGWNLGALRALDGDVG